MTGQRFRLALAGSVVSLALAATVGCTGEPQAHEASPSPEPAPSPAAGRIPNTCENLAEESVLGMFVRDGAIKPPAGRHESYNDIDPDAEAKHEETCSLVANMTRPVAGNVSMEVAVYAPPLSSKVDAESYVKKEREKNSKRGDVLDPCVESAECWIHEPDCKPRPPAYDTDYRFETYSFAVPYQVRISVFLRPNDPKHLCTANKWSKKSAITLTRDTLNYLTAS